MLTLHPPIEPYRTHFFAVDDTHTLYIEESGNPTGIPVVFLHGGPGIGCSPSHRQFFDPARYRIILFDQRGAGRSTPHAELTNNTTQALVADLEKIRILFNIQQWILFGGSWGSTLALVYAETYPERVLHLVLRGIFLCRPKDIAWFYEPGGTSRIFPEYWHAFITHLPIEERDDILKNYTRRLTGSDVASRMAAAKAWSQWEGCCATLLSDPKVVDHFSDPHIALSLARIETHYFTNDSFLKPNQILEDAYRLANIPGTIVHGRYDMICPLDGAYDLHQAWPNANLHIIQDAGHSAAEPGIIDALVRIMNAIAV